MKVISMINMKGGVGKTTLSINVADTLARRLGKRVLVIDIDPQFNASQCLFSTDDYVKLLNDKEDTILDIFDKDTRVSVSTVSGAEPKVLKELSKVESKKIKENLWVIPGNLQLYRLEIAAGDGRESRLKRYLKENKDNYDYVIIDTPPTPSIWMTSALIASDYYLIPTKADPISLTGIDLLNSIVSEKKDNLDLSIKCIGVVLTIVERADSRVFREAKDFLNKSDYWGKLLFNNYLPKRAELAAKQLDNYVLDLQNNEIKRSLVNVVNELVNRIESDEQK